MTTVLPAKSDSDVIVCLRLSSKTITCTLILRLCKSMYHLPRMCINPILRILIHKRSIDYKSLITLQTNHGVIVTLDWPDSRKYVNRMLQTNLCMHKPFVYWKSLAHISLGSLLWVICTMYTYGYRLTTQTCPVMINVYPEGHIYFITLYSFSHYQVPNLYL